MQWDKCGGGYAVFKGDQKVAVVSTQQHCTDVKKMSGEQADKWRTQGIVVWENMPKSSWTIHWCNPMMHVDDVKAVLDSMPSE